MDKTVDYRSIANLIKDELGQAEKALVLLDNELFPHLQAQREEKTPQTTPSEVLREYIKISRDIQATLFDMISRYVLGLEKVSDHILCRRAYHERNKKSSSHTIVAPTVKAQSGGDPAADLLAKFAELTKNMTLEEQEAYMEKLRGGN